MKQELYKKIEIPEGIEVNIDGTVLSVKGPEGENKREFKIRKLDFEKKENKIVIGTQKATKTDKRVMNTIASHIKNMIKGVQEKFEYKLKVCFSHFPFTLDVQGKEVTVKNFLGEKIPRKMKIPEGVEVDVNKEFITVKSHNKELAGQTAANFESITKIKGRDIRVFQDGIYITEKCGVEI